MENLFIFNPLQHKDSIPTVMHYGQYLDEISKREKISRDEARKKYGQFTYSQWAKLLMIFKTKKQQERYNSNCPDGIPKWIRCYDNGGKTFDRYTVVFTKKAITNTHGDRWFMYVGMSTDPFHPQGFGQHGESNNQPVDRPTYGHLGKKIKFEDLPEDCRKLVIRDYLELWDFVDDNGNLLN